jgi:hypothetical protein
MSLTNEDTKNILEEPLNSSAGVTDFTIEQYIGKGSLGKVYSITYNTTGTFQLTKMIYLQ